MNERVITDPEIQHGKPVIRGTRVPITRIVGGLAGGMTREQIMREYEVTEEDIWAAFNYACEPTDRIVHLFRESITLKPAEASFRQGWKETLAGDTKPVSELWESI